MRSLSALAVVLALFGWAGGSAAAAGEDPREIKGRALFARGQYEKALELFSVLFAEQGDPIFLRNIGRCYQKLRQPQPAIDAFREYLRLARLRADAEERAEIEGFIREMEAMKAERSLRSEVVPPPTGPPPARLPLIPPPPPPPPPVAAPTLSAAATPPRAQVEPPQPLLRRWWFWAAVGGALVAGTATAFALGRDGSSSVWPACPAGAQCPRE